MNKYFKIVIISIFIIGFSACTSNVGSEKENLQIIEKGKLANEAFSRCNRYVNAWLQYADEKTSLIPRGVSTDGNYWNAQDAAADNYPFMVLTTSFTNENLFRTTMLDILNTETKHTSRLGACPDDFMFETQSFNTEVPDTGKIIFGSSEYIKDGLLALTEWLGLSPWSDRMIEILDDLHKIVDVMDEDLGKNLHPIQIVEINGELLQSLSRVYWMTGDKKYLDWAVKIGDYYFLGDKHPAYYKRLRLRDHGCEIVLGLCELYATVHFAAPEKKEQYKKPLHRLLDRILEIGRNEHGMFYNDVNMLEGTILDAEIADTWGYTLDGFYIVYLLDNKTEYRDALLKVFSNLTDYYKNFRWEEESSDGYADAIESAINLVNREPDPNVIKWINSEIKIMWAKQKESGIIEGWHGDGNFARTSIMYALMNTQGTSITNWREDVFIGAEKNGNGISIVLQSNKAWEGNLNFDIPRHSEFLNLPIDWPRINQFPEWFTIKDDNRYKISIRGKCKTYKGYELRGGLKLLLNPGEILQLEVREI